MEKRVLLFEVGEELDSSCFVAQGPDLAAKGLADSSAQQADGFLQARGQFVPGLLKTGHFKFNKVLLQQPLHEPSLLSLVNARLILNLLDPACDFSLGMLAEEFNPLHILCIQQLQSGLFLFLLIGGFPRFQLSSPRSHEGITIAIAFTTLKFDAELLILRTARVIVTVIFTILLEYVLQLAV